MRPIRTNCVNLFVHFCINVLGKCAAIYLRQNWQKSVYELCDCRLIFAEKNDVETDRLHEIVTQRIAFTRKIIRPRSALSLRVTRSNFEAMRRINHVMMGSRRSRIWSLRLRIRGNWVCNRVEEEWKPTRCVFSGCRIKKIHSILFDSNESLVPYVVIILELLHIVHSNFFRWWQFRLRRLLPALSRLCRLVNWLLYGPICGCT